MWQGIADSNQFASENESRGAVLSEKKPLH
jgi:hypothetical protein